MGIVQGSVILGENADHTVNCNCTYSEIAIKSKSVMSKLE